MLRFMLLQYYYNPDTGVSTYEVPDDLDSNNTTNNNVRAKSIEATKMQANPMMAGGGSNTDLNDVQMGDLVDVKRCKRGAQRAKIVAVHIGGYEAARDDEGYAYYFNSDTGDSTYDKPFGTQTVDVQFRDDGVIMTDVTMDRLSVPKAKRGKKVGWCRRNWVMVLLFGVGLLGLLFALLCFLEPCKEETVTETVPVTTSEDVWVTKLVPQFSEVTREVVKNVTKDVVTYVERDVVKNVTRDVVPVVILQIIFLDWAP